MFCTFTCKTGNSSIAIILYMVLFSGHCIFGM
uniref:Uncharacterized protein n=1 Tax=Arundo donax TaxID=35708 RepID=A0A0A9B5G7_ARUDO